MNINYLEKLHTDGFLVLNQDDFNFNPITINRINEIFSYYQENEESKLVKVRRHTMDVEDITNNQDLDVIVNNDKNLGPQWFQLWKFKDLDSETEYKVVTDYLNTIVKTLYNVIPNKPHHSQFTSFRKGCGIVRHEDSNYTTPDRVCVVLSYFSKDWKEEYGGNLILNDSISVVPSEKTIVILDFEKNNIPHEVSEVLIDKSRLSLTSFIEDTRFHKNFVK